MASSQTPISVIMKINYYKSWSLAIVALLATVVFSKSDTYSKPYKAGDLAGVWVGFDNYRLNYYRLQLREDGTGFCSMVYVDEPAILYRVNSWKIEGELLAFVLTPLDTGAPEVEMKSTKLGLTPPVLTLEVRGKKLGWVREVSLMSEKEYLEKDHIAKRRIEEFLASKKAPAGEPSVSTNKVVSPKK